MDAAGSQVRYTRRLVARLPSAGTGMRGVLPDRLGPHRPQPLHGLRSEPTAARQFCPFESSEPIALEEPSWSSLPTWLTVHAIVELECLVVRSVGEPLREHTAREARTDEEVTEHGFSVVHASYPCRALQHRAVSFHRSMWVITSQRTRETRGLIVQSLITFVVRADTTAVDRGSGYRTPADPVRVPALNARIAELVPSTPT